MTSSMLEHYQEQNNHGFFNIFVRSEALTAVFTSLIALHANHDNINHQVSIISFSGFQKLDSLLNQTKVKVISCIVILLKYIFVDMIVEEANMAPLTTKLVVLLPHLIESARLFAIDPRLNQMLQNEDYSELMVSLLSVLILSCEQQ